MPDNSCMDPQPFNENSRLRASDADRDRAADVINAALAEGRPAPMPHEDPDMLALVHGVLRAEPAIAGFRLLPGRHGTDLTLCLAPAPTATQVQVRGAVERKYP